MLSAGVVLRKVEDCVHVLKLAPMAEQFRGFVLFAAMVLFLARPAEQLQSSQAQTLVRIRKLLNYPAAQADFMVDFCDSASDLSFTVVCYQDSVTQLHVVGDLGAPPLPRGFSMDSFVKTLSRLPSLKVLTLASHGLRGPLPGKIARLSSLEILNISSNYINGSLPDELSTLTSLQTLVLDRNNFSGPLPGWIGSLPGLTVLSVLENSFDQSLPSSIGRMENLRILALSGNEFVGVVPDLSGLTNLQVLDLEDNGFAGKFPRLSNKLTVLILRKNKFCSGAPEGLTSYYQLQHLDLSSNSFVGPFPQSLFALPSITYLNIAENKFTGLLAENQSCSDSLAFVNISANLFTGKLPDCLSDPKKREVAYSRNCLAGRDQSQEPASFCRNEAVAVGIVPGRKKAGRSSRTVVLCLVGGIIGGVTLIGAIFWGIKRSRGKKMARLPRTRLIYENASSRYTSKMITDARYISQTMKLGVFGLPAYRTFSLEELEEATQNFDSSTFMDDGSNGQMYRGQLKNGSIVVIGSLKMRKRRSIQQYMPNIELISKFRHPHVVSVLGHCFECYWDDSSVSRIFLVFEYVPNGNLRSWISGQHRQPLSWSQRITGAIGVAQGIQYLRTGEVPGLCSNKLKATDVLFDQNLVAKISSYNLPLLAEGLVKGKDGNKSISGGSKDNAVSREKTDDKDDDIHDFGMILLEIITGQPFRSQSEADLARDQLQSTVVGGDEAARRGAVDPSIRSTCADQSIQTLTEICVRCRKRGKVTLRAARGLPGLLHNLPGLHNRKLGLPFRDVPSAASSYHNLENPRFLVGTGIGLCFE